MASLSAKAYAQLSALIEENGLSSILGGISNLTSGNKGKTTKFRNNNEARVTKKTSAKDKKKQLLEQLKEEHPDWKLGCGKGLSLSVLKDAVKSGVKPTPKKCGKEQSLPTIENVNLDKSLLIPVQVNYNNQRTRNEF